MTDERGQSSTLAIAIVSVLALTSALLIAGTASLTLDQSRQVAETESGVQTMTELDSRASLVALEGGDSATIDVRSRAGNGRVSVGDGGEIRFVMRGNNSIIWRENATLGTVTYANGNRRIAYQGGGVWRSTAGSNGSVMVSPPEVHYRQGTLTLPMINISGSDRGISTARARKVSSERVYPIPAKGKNRSNPVPEGNHLVLFVTSDYYRGWAQFFEDRIGGNVTVFEGNRTVRVDLVAPVSQFAVDSGLISVGTGAPIDMQGNAGNPTFVDSYNSSQGDYSNTSGSNGTVRSPSGLDLGGQSFVKGTVNTGGDIEFAGNNNTIFGDAWHQGIIHPGNGQITGQSDTNGSGVEIPPIDGTVNQRVNAICANGSVDLGGGGTIGPGEHCHSGDLRLNKDTLTINVSGGDVDLAVDGDLDLKNNGTIEVVGANGTNNTAELWLGGKSVTLTSAKVTVPDEKSPAFRLFAKSGTDVDMGGNKKGSKARFVGLLYAPTTVGAGGSLDMKSNSSLFGAAVTGEVSMQAGSAVHYDEALEGFKFKRQGTPASHLSYLYVTINEVEFEER